MPKYHANDLLTIGEVAKHFGYAEDYLRALNAQNGAHYDPSFRQLRIKTSSEWRKAFVPNVQYVYQYADVNRWFKEHQALPTVQTYNASHGIEVDL